MALLILVPRALIMSRAHSERIDDEYHIARGVALLNKQAANGLILNDPQVGEALGVLPLWLASNWPMTGTTRSAIWGQRFEPDTVLAVIAVWKSILFIPLFIVVFIWIGELYGPRAGWLATGILLAEPTIAAHLPLPTLDVLAMEGIAIACFFVWRYFNRPSLVRLTWASMACGLAMTLKHTAVIIPGVVAAFGFMWLICRPLMQRSLRSSWRGQWMRRTASAFLAVLIGALTIWSLYLFDVSKPALPLITRPGVKAIPFADVHPVLAHILDHPIPAGLYISAVLEAWQHAARGHPSYLFGKISSTGWWYYFPVVATYKVPIGFALLCILGAISLSRFGAKWDEWSLAIPMVAWTAFMMRSNIDIGWRHFLPAYFFALLLSTRFLAASSGYAARWTIAGWALLLATFLESIARYHPDYLCYLNFPRANAWVAISDSNVDWGECTKYAVKWARQHPSVREIWLRDFVWGPQVWNVRQRVGDRIAVLDRGAKLPTQGVIIVSPVALVGVYEAGDRYRALRDQKPIAILGHTLRVYDLDRLRRNGQPFDWSGKTVPHPVKKKHSRPAATTRR